MKFIALINRTGNGLRLFIAAAVAAITMLLLRDSTQPTVHWMGAWLAFSFTHLFFAWVTLITCNVREIKKIVKEHDFGRTVLSLFILFTSSISLVAILLFYISAGEKSGSALFVHVLMTLSSVGAAWAIVHTTFAYKYAHLYYSYGGLKFPGDENPDYMDFVYFSFVIGTTFQVSDVSIVKSRIRRTVWIHGLLSFIFNTTILAMSINIISSLIQDN